MKKTLLLTLAMFIATVSFAQQQLATLNHNDSITVFYGASALVEAHGAAVDGDIITLSSGIFSPVDITKLVSVRGAGMFSDTSGGNPTIISGDMIIGTSTAPTDSIHYITLEGLYISGDVDYRELFSPRIIKCRLEVLDRYYGTFNNGQVINCIIERARGGHFTNNIIVNSVILSAENMGWGSRSEYNDFENCVLGFSPYDMDDNTFQNCILYSTSSTSYDNWSTSNSCIGICTSTNCEYFRYAVYPEANHLRNYNSFYAVFKYFHDSDSYSDGLSFELQDSIANTFLGDDGTQVGIYGGAMPFNPRVTNPIIKSINVGRRSTPDGKLSVDIEIVSDED